MPVRIGIVACVGLVLLGTTSVVLSEEAVDIRYGYAGGIFAAPRPNQEMVFEEVDDATIYRTYRERPYRYLAEVPAGEYEIRIHSLLGHAKGESVVSGTMDVVLEGDLREQGIAVTYPIRAKDVVSYAPVIKCYSVTVEDGRLEIDFPTSRDRTLPVCGVEVLGDEVALRINCGRTDDSYTDSQGRLWREDRLWPIPVEVSISLDPCETVGKWVNITDELLDKLAKENVFPLARWRLNDAPNLGFTVFFSDRKGNTFANLAGNGMWRYEGPGRSFHRVDGGTYTSLVGYRGLVDNNGNDGGYPQVQINPNGAGVFLVSWCCFSPTTDQIYTPDGKEWINYVTTDRQTWDWGAADQTSKNFANMVCEHHHARGRYYFSRDAGWTWTKIEEKNDRLCVLGWIGSDILIKAQSKQYDRRTDQYVDTPEDAQLAGIFRSTDEGRTWEKVSEISITRFLGPLIYHADLRKAFISSGQGLVIGNADGTQWNISVGSPAMSQPIVFGTTDEHWMGVNAEGFHESRDAGTSWALTVPAPENTECFYWDPVRDVFYAGDYNGKWFRYQR
jgi:photosystem II stability/assembly factor-like uncharacterized protein